MEPPLGLHHRRPTAPQPVAHALHNARRLFVVRPPGAPVLALQDWQSDFRGAHVGGLAAHETMSISAPFIRRPIGTSLLAAALLLSGILAFNFLPVASLPRVDFPVIGVGAGLPGADPQTMASAVATPLERQFG